MRFVLFCALVLVALLLVVPTASTQMPDSAAPDSVSPDSAAADPATFRVYTSTGEAASLGTLVAALSAADVVFLGEQHNDPVAHALQHDLLRAATEADTTRPVALSLEMFEQDVQLVLDEYLAGLVRERDFLAASRPWSNYDNDYRPLVEHAKANGQAVLAANAPARYVRLVSRRGVEALALLPDAARAYLPATYAPASEALSAKFIALMSGMMGHGGSADSASVDGASADSASADTASAGGISEMEASPGRTEGADTDSADADTTTTVAEASPHAGHGGGMPSLDGMLAAQNLRDVAMADAIAQHLAAVPGTLVLHVTGAFHSEGGLGIPEHLARLRPDARALVVTMQPADDLDAFDLEDHSGLGDFVILTDASLPRTYEAGF